MTTLPTDGTLPTLQHEVQRLLGRCLLRLQQYERLIKAIVAHHEIAGPAHALESIRAARIADTASKTLGTLVGQLIGSYVVTDEGDTPAEALVNAPEDGISFGMRMHLSISAEDFVRTESDLKELVYADTGKQHPSVVPPGDQQPGTWRPPGPKRKRACTALGSQPQNFAALAQ